MKPLVLALFFSITSIFSFPLEAKSESDISLKGGKIGITLVDVNNEQTDPVLEKMRLLGEKAAEAFSAGNDQKALKIFQQGLDLAKKTGDKQSSVDFMVSIGWIKTIMHRYDDSLVILEQALAISRSINYLRGEGGAQTNMGRANLRIGDYDKALQCFEQALPIHRKLKDRWNEAATLSDLCPLYKNLGEYEKALSYCKQALRIVREFDDEKNESVNLTNIGEIYLKLQQYEDALKYLEQSLIIKRKHKDVRGIGNNLVSIGGVYSHMGKYEKALEHFLQALEIKKQFKDYKGEGYTLASIGGVYYALHQYEKALRYSQLALETMKALGDKEGQSISLSSIGKVYMRLNRYESALSYFSRASEIDKTINLKRAAENLRVMGTAYYRLGQNMMALQVYNEALSINQELANWRGEAKVMGDIGVLYAELGQNKEGLSYCREAIAIRQKNNDEKGSAIDLGNIATIYIHMGRFEEALANLNAAMAIDRKYNNYKDIAADLTNIGLIYEELSQYEKALSYHQQALVNYRNSGDRWEEGSYLTNIGTVYVKINQYEKALYYFNQALEVDSKTNNKRGQAYDYNNIGVIYQYKGKQELALALVFYEKALTLNKEMKYDYDTASSLHNIGGVYLLQKKYQKALINFNQALKITRKTGDKKHEALVLQNIGLVHRDMQKYETARSFFRKALNIYMELGKTEGIPDLTWLAQRGLGNVEEKLGNIDKAISHYNETFDTIESIRAGITEKETKYFVMQDKFFVYDEFIELLELLNRSNPSKGYDRIAVEVFERKQGRIFLEQMGKAGARNFAGIPDAVLEKENNSARKMTKLQSDRVKEGSKPEKDRDMNHIWELGQQIEKVKAEQQKHQETIKTEHPDYYALKYPKPAALKDIQKHVLEPGEMMLVYGVMKKQTCLWVISKDRLEFYTIQIKEKDLSDKINNFRKAPDTLSKAIKSKLPNFRIKQLARKSGKKLYQDAYELYELLVPEKAKSVISKAKILYIIPTSSLYGLPFEALVTQADEKGVRYLVEDHPIAYLSSASLLKIIRESQARKKEKANHPLLAFANPVYGTKENPCFTLTSSSAKDSSSFSEMRVRGYTELMGGTFCELPGTEDEVTEIKNILKAVEDSLQLREKASRSNVFELNKAARLDDYQYVIFSCHGVLPDKKTNQLNQPALVLSHPDPMDKKDGFLTMADVFGLKLNADLVTLSACNTGRGKQIRGEGVMGLTQAFMYAGTPAVSVTLWSVESESAKILSTGFFRNLKPGKSRAEALRKIKLRMIRGEEGELYKHPYFWAPMVIFGDAGKYRE